MLQSDCTARHNLYNGSGFKKKKHISHKADIAEKEKCFGILGNLRSF